MTADWITAIATSGTLVLTLFIFWYGTVGQSPVIEIGEHGGALTRDGAVYEIKFYIRNRRRHSVYVIYPVMSFDDFVSDVENVSVNGYNAKYSIDEERIIIKDFSNLAAGEFNVYSVKMYVPIEAHGEDIIFLNPYSKARITVQIKEYTPIQKSYYISENEL